MASNSVWIAFALTLIAGLSTGIGSLMALLAKRTSTRFLCTSLGFSAGVMLYVSFMEMIPQGKESLTQCFGEKTGMLYLVLAFFGGIALIMLIDFFIPKTAANPHEIYRVEDMNGNLSLKRVGILVALSLAIHNFPEGMASFISGLGGMDVAIPITLAIAIHNIPEGIAVSVPIYHATGSRRKAFWWSFLSGLAEPLGAVAAYLFLLPHWSPALNGIVLTAVSGIMVFISLDELLPTAEKFGKHHLSVAGLISGMAAMAVSLYLFVPGGQ